MPSKSSSTETIQCGNEKCRATVTPLWRKGWKRTDIDGRKGRDAYVMLCNSCGLHYKKGHFCYHCMQIYREKDCDDSSNPWISCERCHRWVHASCERSINPSLERQIAEEYGFYCQDCRLLKEKLNKDDQLFSNTFPEVKKRRKRPLLSSSKVSNVTASTAIGNSLSPGSPSTNPALLRVSTTPTQNLARQQPHMLFSVGNSSPSTPTTPQALPSLASLFNSLALSPISTFPSPNMDLKERPGCTTSLPPISTLQVPQMTVPCLPTLPPLSTTPTKTRPNGDFLEVIPLHRPQQQLPRQRHPRVIKPLLPALHTTTTTTTSTTTTTVSNQNSPTQENRSWDSEDNKRDEEADGTRHLKLRLKNIRNKHRSEGKSPLKSDKMNRLSPTLEVTREMVQEKFENSKWHNSNNNSTRTSQQQEAKLARLWAVCAAERETMEEAQL